MALSLQCEVNTPPKVCVSNETRGRCIPLRERMGERGGSDGVAGWEEQHLAGACERGEGKRARSAAGMGPRFWDDRVSGRRLGAVIGATGRPGGRRGVYTRPPGGRGIGRL